ncbi:hypothetical protein D3C84_1146190 [compost metagenome]
MKTEIERTRINFDEPNPLLNHVTAQRPAVPGLQGLDQAAKSGETLQYISLRVAVTGIIASFGYIR